MFYVNLKIKMSDTLVTEDAATLLIHQYTQFLVVVIKVGYDSVDTLLKMLLPVIKTILLEASQDLRYFCSTSSAVEKWVCYIV